MVIQYEKNAGLRQGLESLGSSIGGTLQQALQQATAQRKGQYERKGIQTFLSDTLSKLGPDATAQDYIQAFGELSNMPGGHAVAQSLSPLLAPVLKEKQRQAGVSSAWQNILGGETQESTQNQQAQQGMKAEAIQDGQVSDQVKTPQASQQQPKYSESQLNQMITSPYEEIRRFGESIQKQEEAQTTRGANRENLLIKLNEPSLKDLNEKIRLGEENETRFARLNEIYTAEANQLPSSFSAAMFDLEGEGKISKLARSQLTPAAQESIKLITDMLSGAKETYGSRVTNFDAAQYLKRLPSLLNTPEGKNRVLRDLRILNEMNMLHRQAITSEFNKAGGSGAISYSDAEARANRSIKNQIMQLRDDFVHPNKNKFSQMPDAKIYNGRKLEDETTGQVFISNGTEWIRQ